jgi:acyl-Coa thioesterase superfamily protein/acyl-CoA thioesterase superfamily protein
MEPGFTTQGDLLVPSSSAAGPWSSEMVGGRHVAGLIAWAVERDLGTGSPFRVARMTVDMFRPVPMEPLRVTTRKDRDGRRLRMLRVSVWDRDVEVSQASVLLLATSDHPHSTPWAPEDSAMPEPESLDSGRYMPAMSWEFRTATPLGRGRGQVWIREIGPLVAGYDVSPLVRAIAASDFVNPLANSGEDGLEFINADVTVYLSRYPLGEWIGLEVVGHLGADGVAIGSAWLCDSEGRFGQCLTAAMPDARIRRRAVSN